MRFPTLALVASPLLFPAPALGAADHTVTNQAEFDALNTTDFDPGDRILLEGGMTFSGSLLFTSEDLGTDADPIVVTSTGTGRATINAGDAVGINGVDTGGFEISHLNLIGSGVAENGTTTSTKPGVNFFANGPTDFKYPRVHLDQLTVTGFGNRGVLIAGFNGSAGYNDVRITHVVSHGNLRSGIETFGGNNVTDALTNVYVAHCETYHNVGTTTSNPPRASHGIVLGGVDGAIIERCLSYDNGQNNNAVGIWAYSSANVTIQFNESHSNRTAGSSGGAGFAFDVNVSNSVMQYNYSHGNAGAGYSLFDGTSSNDKSSDGNNDNVVRYSISENDGRNALATAASGILAGGRVNRLDVYGNTVFMAGPGAGASFPAAYFYSVLSDPSDILLANNLFVTAGGNPLIWRDSGADTTFAGNNYWPSGGAFSILYNGTTYPSLSAWRTGTGQELLGGSPTGSALDPHLTDPGNGGTVGDAGLLGTLTAYKLQAGSPMVDAGLDLQAEFGIDPGPRDFYGGPLPYGTALDIGAHEFTEAPVVLAIGYTEGTNTVTIDYQSESGVDFGVRRSPDLAGDPATTWTVLPGTGPGDGSVKQYTDNPPPGDSFFYVLVRE
ncbi:MAG: right-handed parallel beta-helix repeat-containing protein [Akkermansiaceae bacterium]|nr:right-handed parallel beta-helix repeat-containing protein [Akkermansiaceae bacterium]NNM28909.1 right-handed parallel beta-helix repeat-containing protein [Akkermansiaceae bacterium]